MREDKKIVIAVGGTGGHLLPAQALAKELKRDHPELEIVFAGGKLGTNPFFQREQFAFKEVRSGSPFRDNPFKALFQLGWGTWQSLKLLRELSPKVVIGFGSFYSFPLLLAALVLQIPYMVVETNAIAGRVNRLFAAKAALVAVQFEETIVKGNKRVAKMPIWGVEKTPSKNEAYFYYGMDPSCFTLLVFGGSQGAQKINEQIARLSLDSTDQVIHFCGKEENAEELAKAYKMRGIRACVKPFEDKMAYAWKAADLAICRAGAATITELLHYQVPSILIPWPGATDRHQDKNAEILVRSGGATVLPQEQLALLEQKVKEAKRESQKMRINLSNWINSADSLTHIVEEWIK